MDGETDKGATGTAFLPHEPSPRTPERELEEQGSADRQRTATGKHSPNSAESSEEGTAGQAGSFDPPLESKSVLLGDYSANSRMLLIAVIACVVGAMGAVLAWIVENLIGLATNLFYFHRWSFLSVDAANHPPGWFAMFAPAVGGRLVGLIARYLSPAVRGHGMPEAVEAIVFGGAKVQPRVAFLKPIATAISIGSGGPFGAEGPVIATGGAVGSLIAQFLPVTEAERTVLMVCGAASGMAAAFACPMSAVLLAVELLLFEWRPRSLVPVAVACATAGAMRRLLLGPGPMFPMSYTTAAMGHQSMLGAVFLGLMCAFVAVGLSRAIHFVEKLYEKLPIHWMWYPVIGGLFVGAGGLLFPQALGTGYSVVGQFVNDNFTWKLIAGVLAVKVAIWIISLSSNTAGGILAPLLMIGGALGAAFSHLLPQLPPGGWAVVGMTALLAAAIGAPLTSAMLAVELTHNGGLLLPVLLACTTGYAISILLQRRSMLTAGLVRGGRHLSREYGVDPLEMMTVNEAMHTSVYALPQHATRAEAVTWLQTMTVRGATSWSHWQRIFPIVSGDGALVGLLTRTQMIAAAEGIDPAGDLNQTALPLRDYGVPHPAALSNTQTLRSAAEEMSSTGLTAYPVVNVAGKFAGILNVSDLLQARGHTVEREGKRGRVLRLRWPFTKPVRATK